MHQKMIFVSSCAACFPLDKKCGQVRLRKKIICCMYGPNLVDDLFEQGQFPANSHPSIVDSDSASGNSSDRVRQTTSLLPVHLCQPCCMQRCNTATVLVLRPAATLNHLVLFGAAPRGTVVAFGPWNNCMHTEIPCRSHTFGDCIPISIEHYFFKKNTHSF